MLTLAPTFALGVLLYELMTGTTPVDMNRRTNATGGEILRRVIEDYAPPLGVRLSRNVDAEAIAARRSIAPAKLARLLRGEIDWIARKALQKNPTVPLCHSQRHGATRVAIPTRADLGRSALGQPTVAQVCPQHPRFLAIATATATMLICATVFSLREAFRATRERSRATIAEADAKAVREFWSKRSLAPCGARARTAGSCKRIASSGD